MEKHPDAHPDPEFTGDMEKDIENIKNWGTYDNYQHGVYQDELRDGYGPCIFMKAVVEIEEDGQIEVIKKWFADRKIPFSLENINTMIGPNR